MLDGAQLGSTACAVLRVTAPVLLLASACAEPAIDLRATFQQPVTSDLSCIDTVQVTLHDDNPDRSEFECLDVSNPSSPDDLLAQLRGRFVARSPDALAAVEIRGLYKGAARCGEGHEVLYGGARFEGEDQIVVPLAVSLDCKVSPIERTLRLVDFEPLFAGGAPRCVDASDIDQVKLGVLRPRGFAHPSYASAVVHTSLTQTPTSGRGIAPVWSHALGNTCIVATTLDSTACLEPTARSACAIDGEVEVPILAQGTAYAWIHEATAMVLPHVVFGTIFTTDGKRPLAGAHVALHDSTKRAAVAYRQDAGGRFVPDASTTTDASGRFALYVDEPVIVQISAPGHHGIVRVLGGVSMFEVGNAALVVLQQRPQ